VVQFAENGIDHVVAVQHVAVLVVAVLQAVRRGVGGRIEPVLVDDAAEAVQAGVLVAGVAEGFARLLHVGEVNSRIRVPALDHGAQAHVTVFGDQAGGAVGDGLSQRRPVVGQGRVEDVTAVQVDAAVAQVDRADVGRGRAVDVQPGRVDPLAAVVEQVELDGDAVGARYFLDLDLGRAGLALSIFTR